MIFCLNPSPFHQGEDQGEGPYQSCAAYPDQRMTLNFFIELSPARREQVGDPLQHHLGLKEHFVVPNSSISSVMRFARVA